MKLLFTICARAGSKGLKSKNLHMFCEEPLVKYTLALYQSFYKKYNDKFEDIQLAVNTDSNELISQINETSVVYQYIPREEHLAGDVVAKSEVIKDTLIKMESLRQTKYDVVIDLDLTSPLRTVEDICGTLEAVRIDENADIAFSVVDARRSPYFSMVSKKENGYYDRVIMADYTCRQDTPVCYDMNGAIYAYRRNYLLKENHLVRKAAIWKMKDIAVLDIDCEQDLIIMEVIAKHYFSTGEFSDITDEIKLL